MMWSLLFLCAVGLVFWFVYWVNGRLPQSLRERLKELGEQVEKDKKSKGSKHDNKKQR